MANPQKENGFTGIANELLEVTQMHKFTLNELKIIMCVWRFTYGFNRKSHTLSMGFIMKHTGLNRSRVNDSLKKLIKSKVLKKIEQGNARTSNIISFNKNHDEWKVEKYSSFTSNESDTSVQDDTSTQNDTSTSVQDDTSTSVQDDTKERNTKENNKEIQVREIFDYYISKNIIQHKKLDSDMKKKISSRINKYGMEELKSVIDNYSIVFSSDDYWFTHKYTLMDLMRDKDIRQFGSEADPLYNFAKDKNKQKEKQLPKKELTIQDHINDLDEYLEMGRDYYIMSNIENEYDEMLRERDRLEQLRDNQGKSSVI